MLKTRIIELVGTIPAESNIYAEAAKPDARRAPAPTAAEVQINRRAHAVLDPSFPWKYAKAFAELHQHLPAMVDESFIRMAHEHLSGRVNHDDITEAQVIWHPKWAAQRGLLEALLILPDLRLDEIAGHTSLPVSLVMVYEQLFWSVRDRLNDKLFVTELCYPNTRLAQFRGDYWDTAEPRELMLHAAFNRDLDTVLRIFGARQPGEEQPAETSAKKVKARIMADADFVMRAGGGGSTIPVLDAARKMIVATEKYAPAPKGFGDDLIGLTALSMTPGESILETVRQMCDSSDHQRRVALQAALTPATN